MGVALRRGWLVAAVALVAGLVLVPVARAAGEYEQNDTIQTAFGPLVGGADYTGTFETDNDVDWFVFYIKAYSQMDFSATSIGSSCVGDEYGSMRLLDKDGKHVDWVSIGRQNEFRHLHLTMNPGRYYFEVDNPGEDCTGRQYRFRIDPAAAITPSRVCGEAIVSRESVGPDLAAVNAKIAKNGEALGKMEALVATRKAALAKLKQSRRAPRWKKQRARKRLAEAKAAREKVEIARIGLQTLGAHYTTVVNQANAQIATSC